MLAPIEHRIALELGARPAQVIAAITLLDEGATVPFISRYRKEATGGLDDTQLRNLEERLTYLRDLEDRRVAIVASIDEQGKLTPELRAEVMNAETKQRLEDLYLPYKQKAPDQGADRPRSRHRAAGAGPAGRPEPDAGSRSREIPQRRCRLCRRQGRTRRRPPDPDGKVCRGRRVARSAPRIPARTRHAAVDRH
jgi:hypothetical protein